MLIAMTRTIRIRPLDPAHGLVSLDPILHQDLRVKGAMLLYYEQIIDHPPLVLIFNRLPASTRNMSDTLNLPCRKTGP